METLFTSYPLLMIAFMVWWTFAVPLAVFVISEVGRHTRDEILRGYVMAVFWPVALPVFLVIILWQSIFDAPHVLRRDLHNRKLMKDFDEYMKKRVLQPGDTKEDQG